MVVVFGMFAVSFEDADAIYGLVLRKVSGCWMGKQRE
jgi:hypothetical protein